MKLGSNNISSIYLGINAVQSVYLGTNLVWSGVDPDAQAFFNRVTTAGGTLSATEQLAINTLVVQMKADGIWTKMKAIYPMVGASAASCAQNLKSSSFTGTFFGGWTFASTGAKPNGTNAYMTTSINPSVELQVNSNSVGYYTGTNLSEINPDPIPIGAFHSLAQALLIGKSNSNFATRINGNAVSHSTSLMKGFFIGSRQSSTVTDMYIDGAQVATGNSGGTLPTNNINLAATVVTVFYGFTTNDFRYAFIADGLSDTEAANYYTAVQAFQTTLSRNV
jgi:hypothetical protein